jgi:hypothetical protein
MDVVVFVGRIPFRAISVAGSAGHLAQPTMMTGLARHKGMLAARLVVLGSGLVLVAAVFMIIPGVWADLAALLLFVFLVPTALVMPAFPTGTSRSWGSSTSARISPLPVPASSSSVCSTPRTRSASCLPIPSSPDHDGTRRTRQ